MIKKNIIIHVRHGCLFLLFTVAATAGQAQVVEEIIVTATKRETSLQDTPMSITALGEFELQRIGAEGIFDYGVKIPNLGFSNEADGRFNSGSPALRGVAGGGVVGATGFYIDDIPVPEYMNPRVSDISRVEVLRGPQGTLYGARSMGGTVRVITKQAHTDEFDGYLRSSISDVKEGDINWRVDGSVNAPLVEGVLGARALFYYAQNSGIFDRVHIPGSNRPAFNTVNDVDDDEFYGGAVSFVWNASDNISIRPRFMYQRTDSDNLPLADLSPGNFDVPRHNNIEEPGEEEWWLASVTVNIDTGFGEIASTTARFGRKIEEYEDQTGTLDGLIFAANGLPEPHIPSFIYEEEEHELRAGLEMLTRRGHLKFFEDYLYHCYVQKPDPDFVRDMLSEAARTPDAVARELIRTSFDLDYREVARRIDNEIPVMQVVREDWKSAAGQWISENQPNARIYYMPAHLSFHEYAEDFNAHMLEFVDGCYRTGGRTDFYT